MRPIIPSDPKCIYFTGAGLYYYWQAGAAQYLQENCDLSKQIVVGASAGSLTATLLLARVDFVEAAQNAIRLADEKGVFSMKTGLVGVLASLLREWLEQTIPIDVNMENFSKLQISVTPLLPFQKSELITNFRNREDLIDACMASCHVPFFLDTKPYVMYRDRPTVDGSFYYFLTKDRTTGLPIPDVCNGSCDDIFWVDYGDDESFVSKISGNFLELITPDGALDMIKTGYEFMRKEHEQSRLPMARFLKPTVVSNIVSKIVTLPKKISNMRRLIQISD